MELLTGAVAGASPAGLAWPLRVLLSLAIVAVSPWVGRGVYKLAPSEVSFAKGYLQWAYAVLIALAAFLFSRGLFSGDVGWLPALVIAGIFLWCSIRYHPLRVWPLAGLAGVGAFVSGDLVAPSVLVIAGIIVGSLDHKKRDLLIATGACLALGLLAWFRLIDG